MTTFDSGRRAETAVAKFLESKGCKILAQNWRTPLCEIDIVATRRQVVYFCEVKYREHAFQGFGLEYVTPKKLDQMHFAAETWMHHNQWQGECELCAIEVSGPDYQITAVAKNL